MRHPRAGHARGRADRALELGRAERVHDPRAHGVALDQPLRAGVGVGQDRLAAVLLAHARETGRHAIERLVPRNAPEAPLPLGALAHERMQQPLVRVDALQVVRHLAAEEPDGDRMVGVAGHLDGAPVLHGHVHRAGVGTVVRAGGAHEASGHAQMVRPPEASHTCDGCSTRGDGARSGHAVALEIGKSARFRGRCGALGRRDLPRPRRSRGGRKRGAGGCCPAAHRARRPPGSRAALAATATRSP